MKTQARIALICLAALAGATPALAQDPAPTLAFPEQYREWVFLSSGFDMSYNPPAKARDHHIFNNVFVNAEAYKAFVATGTWPDGTMLVLEARMGEGKGSINKAGQYQGTDIMGLEVHVKDHARFEGQPGDWAFFSFDSHQPATMIPTTERCYACHAAHGAVDNTFVQFYPTLLPIAQAKNTTTASYRENP
jgi:hypothetical protein